MMAAQGVVLCLIFLSFIVIKIRRAFVFPCSLVGAWLRHPEVRKHASPRAKYQVLHLNLRKSVRCERKKPERSLCSMQRKGPSERNFAISNFVNSFLPPLIAPNTAFLPTPFRKRLSSGRKVGMFGVSLTNQCSLSIIGILFQSKAPFKYADLLLSSFPSIAHCRSPQ